MSEAGIVYTQVERPPADLVAAFQSVGVASIHEAMGRVGLMDWGIRPLISGRRVSGPAVTALMHPGDNLALHVAMHYAQPGDILVATAGNVSPMGVFGDMMGTSAMARGIAALVLDSAVRDAQQLREMGFPVWSREVWAQGSVKESLVGVNIPVVCAGAAVDPGDIIVADDDGVVVVPNARAEQVLELTLAREKDEAIMRSLLAEGQTIYSLRGMEEKLRKKGVRIL